MILSALFSITISVPSYKLKFLYLLKHFMLSVFALAVCLRRLYQLDKYDE